MVRMLFTLQCIESLTKSDGKNLSNLLSLGRTDSCLRVVQRSKTSWTHTNTNIVDWKPKQLIKHFFRQLVNWNVLKKNLNDSRIIFTTCKSVRNFFFPGFNVHRLRLPYGTSINWLRNKGKKGTKNSNQEAATAISLRKKIYSFLNRIALHLLSLLSFNWIISNVEEEMNIINRFSSLKKISENDGRTMETE